VPREPSAQQRFFWPCPQRVYLGRNDSNVCDGNVYDAGDKGGLFDIQEPAPRPQPGLDTWQTEFGQDKRSVETAMQAEFDLAKSQLRFSCGTVPETCVPVAPLGEVAPAFYPGPFRAQAWSLLRDGSSWYCHCQNDSRLNAPVASRGERCRGWCRGLEGVLVFPRLESRVERLVGPVGEATTLRFKLEPLCDVREVHVPAPKRSIGGSTFRVDSYAFG